MLVALHNIFRILALIAVRLLNRAAAGRIVARNRQTKFRAIRQIERRLYQPLSKRPPSNNQRAIIVLQRTGKNFRGRCTALIDQHDQTSLLQLAFCGGHRLGIVFLVFPFREHDLFPGRQKFIR